MDYRPFWQVTDLKTIADCYKEMNLSLQEGHNLTLSLRTKLRTTKPTPILQIEEEYEDYVKSNTLTDDHIEACGWRKWADLKMSHGRAVKFEHFKEWEVCVWQQWLIYSFFTNTPDFSMYIHNNSEIQFLTAVPENHNLIPPTTPKPINRQSSPKQQQAEKQPTAQEILQLVSDAIMDGRIDGTTLKNHIREQEFFKGLHDHVKAGQITLDKLDNFVKELKAKSVAVPQAIEDTVPEQQPDIDTNVGVPDQTLDSGIRAQGTKRRRENAQCAEGRSKNSRKC